MHINNDFITYRVQELAMYCIFHALFLLVGTKIDHPPPSTAVRKLALRTFTMAT